MIKSYKIEYLPRFGTTMGVIWKEYYDEESTYLRTETIGHIRIQDKEEEEQWKKVIETINKQIQEQQESQ